MPSLSPDHLVVNPKEFSAGELNKLLEDPAMQKALELFRHYLVFSSGKKLQTSDVAEVVPYSPISTRYNGQFASRERRPGELFMAKMRGHDMPNVVVDPSVPSVVRIKDVIFDGTRRGLTSLLRELFGSRNLDGVMVMPNTDAERQAAPFNIMLAQKPGSAVTNVTLHVRKDLKTDGLANISL